MSRRDRQVCDEGQCALYAQTTPNSSKPTARLLSNSVSVHVVTRFALVCCSAVAAHYSLAQLGCRVDQ
jgi:hypothetical protein